jgi:hypothetical protein
MGTFTTPGVSVSYFKSPFLTRPDVYSPYKPANLLIPVEYGINHDVMKEYSQTLVK